MYIFTFLQELNEKISTTLMSAQYNIWYDIYNTIIILL